MHELKSGPKLEQNFIGNGDKNFCNAVIGFVFLNKSNKHTHHGQSQLHGTIAYIFHIYMIKLMTMVNRIQLSPNYMPPQTAFETE